jgi:hypothetical protein
MFDFIGEKIPQGKRFTRQNLFCGQRVPDATESDRLKIFAIGCGKFFNTKVPKSKAQSQIDDPAKRK